MLISNCNRRLSPSNNGIKFLMLDATDQCALNQQKIYLKCPKTAYASIFTHKTYFSTQFYSCFLYTERSTFKIPQKETNTTIKKPVIVYIHPGGFYGVSSQSKNFAGPQILMDRDIVLVTINYRLGSLGMLSLGTSEYPGNAAFKDQILALNFVKYHIKHVKRRLLRSR